MCAITYTVVNYRNSRPVHNNIHSSPAYYNIHSRPVHNNIHSSQSYYNIHNRPVHNNIYIVDNTHTHNNL